MSLPENPYDEIDHDYGVTVDRDKEWARWLLDRWPGTTDKDFDYALIEINKADFEALKKLKEGKP